MARARSTAAQRAEMKLALIHAAGGALYSLLAASLFLALGTAIRPLIGLGSVARPVADEMFFYFGRWAAFAVPSLFALFAAKALFRRLDRKGRPFLDGAGAAGFVVSLCALSSLVTSQSAKASSEAQFFSGGFVGAFLTLTDGLGIADLMGPIGATLLFVAVLVAAIGILLAGILRDFFDKGRSPADRAGLRPAESLFSSFGRNVARISPANARAQTDRRWAWSLLFHAPARFFAHLVIPRRARVMFPPAAVEEEGPRIIDRRDSGGEGEEDAILSEEEAAPEEAAPEAPRAKKSSGGRVARERGEKRGAFFENLQEEPQGVQEELQLFPVEYKVPPLGLLNPSPRSEAKISREEILETSGQIERTLADFGIEGRVTEVVQGPVVTRYEVQPAAGVKVARIASLDRELAMSLLAEHVRIQAPIPGKSTVGVEAPNKKTNAVFLRDILSSDMFQKHASPLAFGLGKDITGEPMICDLAEMPHLMIAGATGAGKSVCINSIVISMLMRMSPDQVKFIMIDPKRVELSNYQDIPHLLAPVVTDPRKAAGALSWAVFCMEERYRQLERLHVRNIGAFNKIVCDALDNGRKPPAPDLEPMPYMVLIVDELADLMLVARSEVEESIQRLAQMSRAVGIHLIIATQRPSVNVITGVIKANFPTRIAFRVSSQVDSRTILDGKGAEALLGRGDMLYSPGGGRLSRIQGAYVSDSEVERVGDMIREQGPARYEKEDFAAARSKKEIAAGGASGSEGVTGDEEFDPDEFSDEALYARAVKLVLESKQASVSLIQRRLKIGYARAGRLMDMMQEAGIVGPFQGSKPRDLLVDPEEHLAQLESEGVIARRDAFLRG